jgi:hypothetical protein
LARVWRSLAAQANCLCDASDSTGVGPGVKLTMHLGEELLAGTGGSQAHPEAAHFIGGEAGAGEPFAEEVQVMFLDGVLHVAASALELFVEPLRRICLPGKVGDDKARVVLVAEDLGLADHPASPAP